jgi:hypothetical protein
VSVYRGLDWYGFYGEEQHTERSQLLKYPKNQPIVAAHTSDDIALNASP